MCISCTDGERAEGMAPVYVYDMINIATRVDAYMAGFVFVLFFRCEAPFEPGARRWDGCISAV